MQALVGLLAAVLTAPPALSEDAPAPKPPGDIPVLAEEAAAAGIAHVYGGPWEYFVGGGVAAFDCNDDRRPDLFLAGGKNEAALYVNRSEVGGALRFAKGETGLSGRDLTRVTGAYPLDIDNDGIMDLAVLRVGENLLLKGKGACRFEVANRAFGFDGGRGWTTAFAAEWEPGEAFPTLAFGQYVDRSAPGSPWGTCHDNFLFRPQKTDRAGAAAPDYSDPDTLSPGYCALSMLFTDWNRSGEASLRITNDRQYYRGGEEQLWKVPPKRPPKLYTASDGWRRLMIWGMGIAEADLDADGYPEYALTSMGDNKLEKLDPEAEEDRPVYENIAYDLGAMAHRPYTGGDLKPSTAWHAGFADFNNDGLSDLFIAKGNVEAMPDFAAFDPDNLLLGLWQGGFAEAGKEAGIALDRRGRGAAIADLNLDGMLDLVVVNREAPVSLFRNCGVKTGLGAAPLGNFVEIAVSQEGANRNAVGARLSVKTGTHVMARRIQTGGGHASGSAGFVHVGLGTAERAEIRIEWPDGEWSHPYRVFANQFVVIRRGEAAASYWYPPQ
ncbi:CRTAC1 family protein [Afifella sp. IM 167]|uniref:CRTAC1 family protein n=1 Tax=Afifella sp. IM 167 TaxID=2033586 RepID=UPI001CCB0C09|nr:CRTAC1 family protein [Afifella sp. IM 167]MBZ8133819.1 hypothetical protein [Afifella sp. IM 167]